MTRSLWTKKALERQRASDKREREKAQRERDKATKAREKEKSELKKKQIFLPGMKEEQLARHKEREEQKKNEIDATTVAAPRQHHPHHHKKSGGILGFLTSSSKKDKKAEKKAEKEEAKPDENGVYAAPATGTRVRIQGLNKNLDGQMGEVVAEDKSNFFYAVKLDDGRTVKKIKLATIRFLPGVGTHIKTRALKADMTGLKGTVTVIDSPEAGSMGTCQVLLEDKRTLRRMKIENLLSLPPLGTRVKVGGEMKAKGLIGQAGQVTAIDEGKFVATVKLDDSKKILVLSPDNLVFEA